MKSPDGGCVIEYVEVVGDTLDLSVTYEDKFGRPLDLIDFTSTLDIFLPDVDTTTPLLTLPVVTGNSQRNLEVLVSPTDTTTLGKGLFRSQLKLVDNTGKVNSLILGKITLVDPNSSSLRLPNKPSGGNRVVIENNKLSIRLEATQGLRGGRNTLQQDFTNTSSVTVIHSLGFKPIPQVFDISGNLIIVTPNHINLNRFDLTFNESISGFIIY